MSRSTALVSLAVLVSAVPAASQTKPAPAPAAARGITALEKRATLTIESLRNSPLELRNYLRKMPKGSDLHNHLYGAIYAETWIQNAADDNMCIDRSAIRGTLNVYSPAEGNPPVCPAGKL